MAPPLRITSISDPTTRRNAVCFFRTSLPLLSRAFSLLLAGSFCLTTHALMVLSVRACVRASAAAMLHCLRGLRCLGSELNVNGAAGVRGGGANRGEREKGSTSSPSHSINHDGSCSSTSLLFFPFFSYGHTSQPASSHLHSPCLQILLFHDAYRQ